MQIGIGLSVLYGGLARAGGAALCLLWLIGTGVVGLESMLENAHYLGFGAFFLLTGRGPYAVDRLLFPAFEPTPRLSRLAMPSLRIGTGLGLTIVAFTEKLANPELARAFLHHHPLNFTAWLHIPLSDDIFVVCAGSTELLIGLCLIFGIFPRLIVASAWVLINMSLTVFNWVELVGHLPSVRRDGDASGVDTRRGRTAAVDEGCPREMSGACGGAANAERCVTEARPGLQWFLWDTSGQPTDATIHIHPMRAFVDSECQLRDQSSRYGAARPRARRCAGRSFESYVTAAGTAEESDSGPSARITSWTGERRPASRSKEI